MTTPRPQPLRIGDFVKLNSGGPTLLVVDFEGGKIVCAQDNGIEHVFPSICITVVRKNVA